MEDRVVKKIITQQTKRTLGLKTLGFFVFRGKDMKYMKIDYTELNNRIVKQAYESLPVLNKEDLNELIQGKFDRAKQYQEAMQKLPMVD